MPRARVLRVHVALPLDQPSDQQAVAAVLSSLPSLHLGGQNLPEVFCQEAVAMQAGDSDGLWLLPALNQTSTLTSSASACSCTTVQCPDPWLPAKPEVPCQV